MTFGERQGTPWAGRQHITGRNTTQTQDYSHSHLAY